MKYDHLVKYNGKYYSAGEDVPVDAKKPDNDSEEQNRRGRKPAQKPEE